MWKDYCQIVKAFGGEWTIKWTDGEVQEVSSKILALAIQPGQEVIIKGRLMVCTEYRKNKACFTYVDLVSGDESPYVPPKKKSKSKKKRPSKQTDPDPAPATVPSTDPDPATLLTANALAVASALALSKPAAPDKETLDEAHLRINSSLAAVEQVKEINKWKPCRYKRLSKAMLNRLSKIYDVKNIPYVFAERSVQAYAAMQKSADHRNAANLFRSAVNVTLTQVVPVEGKPLKGNTPELVEALFPVLRKV